MSQLKSKAVPLVITVVVISAVAAGALALNSKSKEDNSGSAKGTSSSLDTNKEYSPTELYSNLSSYTGKELKFKGRLFKVGGTEYFIVGKEKKPGAVKLDLKTNNIDPAKYVYNNSDPAKPGSKPDKEHDVVVTGKVVRDDPKGPSSFVVSSISD
jgi:hypothetical protein